MAKFKNLAQVKGFGVAPYNSLPKDLDEIDAKLYFFVTPNNKDKEQVLIEEMYLNSVRVKDLYGNR